MKITKIYLSVIIALLCTNSSIAQVKRSFSGVYPHLASYNNEPECGTGAVVPWANRLFVITYGPHRPFGSSDKLYEIDNNLNMVVRKESIGGTPANRMIHAESNQLFIGPYAIDADRQVRAIPYSEMQGRHTGNARDLKDPSGKIICATMEEGFYRIDTDNLEVETLFADNQDHFGKKQAQILDGAHGKGVYSGQGVLVYSNNGENSGAAIKFMDITSGILAEWDGKKWETIRRNQFVEVTGPGGIHGNKNPKTDPIWATGWDHRSVLLGSRDNGKWTFYRLPKASHSYDGAHGWNTEWPRIRDIGTEGNPDYLMTMHGMFWQFPHTFTSKSSVGIRPQSAYLKVIGDFTRWNDKIVMGCDDSAQKEFLNVRKAKGGVAGPGQSNSNLWFVDRETIKNLGPTDAVGAVWLNDEVKRGVASEPMLFAGWKNRAAWINNSSNVSVKYTFDIDEIGNGKWVSFKSVTIPAGGSKEVIFAASEAGEWIRVKASHSGVFSAQFIYKSDDLRATTADAMFAGLSKVDAESTRGALLYGLGNNDRKMGVVSYDFDGVEPKMAGYYELGADMILAKADNPAYKHYISTEFNTPKDVISVDASSVLVADDADRRWRLPLSPTHQEGYTLALNNGVVRICREVATERDLFNAAGTFYELPSENADGYAKIRPISSHSLRIHDYASYRGLLVMSGIDPSISKGTDHIIISDDGKAAVWAGVIDDLWKLGKPVGVGGPWSNSKVVQGVPSDPYLIGSYDKKSLELSHNSKVAVEFTIEVNIGGNGKWLDYKTITVNPSQVGKFVFPDTFNARWVRFVASNTCNATAYLEYR